MPSLLQKAKTKIFYDLVDGKKYYAGGLLPHIEDPRDFKLGIFGWGDYKPKHDKLRIPTISIKNQFRNTCTMASITVQKEVDEKTPLNVMLHVQNMKRLGFVTADGFSDLRSNQNTVQKYGIPDASLADERKDSWEDYSRFSWTKEIEANAYSHRSASYWNTKAKNEILKLLDDGRVLNTGSLWYEGFNMRGGFKFPWIIEKPVNFEVGGHAYDIVGYDQNYQGYGLCLIFQNSYGTGYGDNGDFYMPMEFALKFLYTCYAQLDIEVDVGKFLQKYEGKFVKAKGQPAIYRINNGTKEAFPSWISFIAFGGARKGYELIEGQEIEQLSQVPIGTILEIQYSPYWNLIKDLTSNMEELTRVINEALEWEKNFK